jgi:hypothetical protein
MEELVLRRIKRGLGELIQLMDEVKERGIREIEFSGESGKRIIVTNSYIAMVEKVGNWHTNPFEEKQRTTVLLSKQELEKVLSIISQLAPWPKTKE